MSCASPLTLLSFMAKWAFRKTWTVVFPFSKICFDVLPHTIMTFMLLHVFWSFTVFQCSLDWSMADDRAVFPPLEHTPRQLQVHWTPIQMKANCVLHSAAKRIEKNVLACLASLTSNSRLLAPLSQHHSSQVTVCSPGQHCNSFT